MLSNSVYKKLFEAQYQLYRTAGHRGFDIMQ